MPPSADDGAMAAAPSTAQLDTETAEINAMAVEQGEAVFNLQGPKEYLQLACGIGIIAVCAMPIGVVLLGAMLWEWADRGFDGAFVNSGKELSGLLCGRVAPWFNTLTQKMNERFVKRVQDAYMVNSIVCFGIGVPALFALAAANHVQRLRSGLGLNLCVWFMFHLIRIGPYFMNFAYVYTLCHKEGHSRTGLYSKGYNSSVALRNVFNWWIGLFYGVMPGTFKYGHSVNHHRYNNGADDVVTTSDKPRDSFVNYICFLPRWFLYASNVSSTLQFLKDGDAKVAFNVLLGNAYFAAWMGLVSAVAGPWFAVAYVGFPFVESGILLASVNWSWHAFLDPCDPENEYVQSITIIDGPINVLEEDFHVVHHQYPGGHWMEHLRFFQKHWPLYGQYRASVFRNTHAFEIFGMVLARDYDMLAQKFVDVGAGEARMDGPGGRPAIRKPDGSAPRPPMTHEERVFMIKARLRGCWWGPRVDPRVTRRLTGKEVGNVQYGKGINKAQSDADFHIKEQ